MCFVLFRVPKLGLFFCETNSYLYSVPGYAWPVANATIMTDSQDLIYQQDGAPPHFHHNVLEYLDATLAHRWIGRGSQDDYPLLPWPRRSSGLLHVIFSLWIYVKNCVFVPVLPCDFTQLRERILHGVTDIDCQMLGWVWDEQQDYRIDVYHVTNGEHL